MPGGAASTDSGLVADRVLLYRLQEFKSIFNDAQVDENLEQMKSLVAGLSTHKGKQNQFVSLLGTILDQYADPDQLSEDEGKVTVSQRAQNGGGANLLRSFARPILPKTRTRGGRAAAVGGLRGRLVTAVVDGPNALRVQTLLLLQAAYSHNAKNFEANKSGFFHAVVDNAKVAGPILITHSNKDRAVGLAYPLASRLNGDDGACIGDANDRFGGMGANGAQHIDKAHLSLLREGAAYDFKTSGKRVFNLNGDSIIQSHGDVARPETTALLATAMNSVAHRPGG